MNEKEFRKFEALEKKYLTEDYAEDLEYFITSVQKHKIHGIIITFMLDGFFLMKLDLKILKETLYLVKRNKMTSLIIQI